MKLTLPAAEPGFRWIHVDGQRVGCALDQYSRLASHHQAWRAHLWHFAGRRDAFERTEPFASLRELRAALEKRLADRGPWWA